jgi:hypothetical protein
VQQIAQYRVIGGSYEWLPQGGARNFDVRTLPFSIATINMPAIID